MRQNPPAPSPSSPGDVTRLLRAWSAGDKEALAGLLPLVYAELRQRARTFMRRERAGHTLQPTALVHEAYMKLVDQKNISWKDRAHFFGVAARAMREVLVDHARRHAAEKRGAAETRVTLTDASAVTPPRDSERRFYLKKKLAAVTGGRSSPDSRVPDAIERDKRKRVLIP